MKTLKISKDISLPTDVVTQTIAILAKRRAGKSYTMRKLVEELLENEQQVVLVDPKGDQWGIRSSADGKAPGYPIVILGGEHGDAPLEASAGEVVAKLVVEERVSILLDLSTFRKHEIATFMAIFLETLYRLKAREEYRTPVMLVIDEADAIAPQKPQKGEERMLGAADDIVRRGGQRGIGCALITQRSAVLNKNVLTQAQMLIVLRTIAPQDLAAMRAWIEVHGTVEEGKEMMESLPSLPVGDAWFWSPGWPTTEGIFKRSHVLPITTFDSGATPAPGVKKVVPKNLADVDLEALKKQMSATIEKAKNDDPKLLRKRITELETAAKQDHSNRSSNMIDVAVSMAVKEAVLGVNRMWQGRMEKLSANFEETTELLSRIKKMIPDTFSSVEMTDPVVINNHNVKELKEIPEKLYGLKVFVGGPEAISKSERRILDTLAWFESVGIKTPNVISVGFLAKFSPGGHFTNLKGGLRTKGLIEYQLPGTMSLTPAGASYAVKPDTILTQEDLQRSIKDMVGPSYARILDVLLAAHPGSLAVEEVREAAGFSEGGHFTNLKGRLHSMGLVDYPRPGRMCAADLFFI